MQEKDYYKQINDIMAEKLKHPHSLFDAESLASHISIVTSQSGTDMMRKSGSNQSSKGKRGSKNSKLNSSQSGVKKSKDEESSNMSGSTSQVEKDSTTKTTGGGGDFKTVKAKDIEYVNEELPPSMMNAIRIIERLLTQSKFHEQHVLYKAYP